VNMKKILSKQFTDFTWKTQIPTHLMTR
jgi:hypothetical protein